MTDDEQPTRDEAQQFWNSLTVANQQRLLDGIDPEHDTDLMQILESEGMLFRTANSADGPSAATATESVSPETASEVPQPSLAFASELQKIIDLGATGTMDD